MPYHLHLSYKSCPKYCKMYIAMKIDLIYSISIYSQFKFHKSQRWTRKDKIRSSPLQSCAVHNMQYILLGIPWTTDDFRIVSRSLQELFPFRIRNSFIADNLASVYK